MWENLAQFDILGVGALLGALLYFGILIWFLVGNRSFQELERRHVDRRERADRREREERQRTTSPETGAPTPTVPEHGKSPRPRRPGRAA